jgi:predicted enzyme related to lactoylglutathione lyase
MVATMTTDTTSTTASDTDAAAGPQWPVITFPQVTWFEVHTAEQSGAVEFYRGLFGWTFTPMGDDYQDIKQGDGQLIGGGLADTGGQWPSTVIPCVQVHDVAATVDKAGELGGKVLAGPNETPTGITFAYLADREGSAFGIWSPPTGS